MLTDLSGKESIHLSISEYLYSGILLNNILNTAELEIKNYLLKINNTKVGYTKDANNNLRINQFEDVNYIFHYIL